MLAQLLDDFPWTLGIFKFDDLSHPDLVEPVGHGSSFISSDQKLGGS